MLVRDLERPPTPPGPTYELRPGDTSPWFMPRGFPVVSVHLWGHGPPSPHILLEMLKKPSDGCQNANAVSSHSEWPWHRIIHVRTDALPGMELVKLSARDIHDPSIKKQLTWRYGLHSSVGMKFRLAM